jgi:hypothetical protein
MTVIVMGTFGVIMLMAAGPTHHAQHGGTPDA